MLADGERGVVVRPPQEGRGDEPVARDVADGGQHGAVTDTTRLELLDDHPFPLALEVYGHGKSSVRRASNDL